MLGIAPCSRLYMHSGKSASFNQKYFPFIVASANQRERRHSNTPWSASLGMRNLSSTIHILKCQQFLKTEVLDIFASCNQCWPLGFQAYCFIKSTRWLSDVFQEIVDVMLADSVTSLMLWGGWNSSPSFKKHVYFAVSHVLCVYEMAASNF